MNAMSKKSKKLLIIAIAVVFSFGGAFFLSAQPELSPSRHYDGAQAIVFNPYDKTFNAVIDGMVTYGENSFTLTNDRYMVEYAFAKATEVVDGALVKQGDAIGVHIATTVEMVVYDRKLQKFIDPTRLFKRMGIPAINTTENMNFVWLFVIGVIFIGVLWISRQPNIFIKVAYAFLCLVGLLMVFSLYMESTVKADEEQPTPAIAEPTQTTISPIEPTIVATEETYVVSGYDANCALKPFWNTYPYSLVAQWETLIEDACVDHITELKVGKENNNEVPFDYPLKGDIHLADLIATIMINESSGQPDVISRSGAVGLMQVMPRDGLASQYPSLRDRPTIQELLDPDFNVSYGTGVLIGNYERTGDWKEALKGYGPIDVGYDYADEVWEEYQLSISQPQGEGK